jgi:hypothetical protein
MYPLLCQIIIKLEFSQLIFKRHSYIKFYENLSCGSQVVCHTDRHDKLVVTFRNFAKAPKYVYIVLAKYTAL